MIEGGEIPRQELLKRLKALTPRRLEVLSLRCATLDYEAIAEELVIAKNTVKTHMGNIYKELGLDGLERAQRQQILWRDVCPLLEEIDLADLHSETEEPEEEPEPVSEDIERMVEDDEFAIISYRPTPLTVPGQPEERNGGCRSRFRTLLIGLILGLLLTLGGFYAFQSLTDEPESPPQVSATQEVQTAEVTVVQTVEVTREILVVATPEPSPTQPTSTPVVQEVIQEVTVVVTATPPPATPTATNTPTPLITLPFADDFDDGISAEWQQLKGAWITDAGRLTVLNAESPGWSWILLDEPSWTDYKVTVDLGLPNYGSLGQGSAFIAVRVLESQSEFLGTHVGARGGSGLALINRGNGNVSSISTSVGGYNTPQSSTVEIEVVGDQIIVRVNGAEVQNVTLPSSFEYDQGGVVLGVACSNSCPNYDNLQVEPISQ